MEKCNHSHACQHPVSSASQTLDELDFERGPWSAALEGDLKRLTHLLKNGTVCADVLDSAGYSPLHYAARAGHVDIVKYLISAGADVNLQTRANGSTSLHRASQQGHDEVVKLLLSKGADIRLKDSDGCTALHRAASSNRVSACRLLLSHDMELVNIPDSRNRLPQECCSDGYLRSLLDQRK